jgi:predicted O-methyltransferase YrrM
MIDPTRIFEFGSGYGYSALWFARASRDDCEIFCTDMSEENAELANQYFKRAEISHKINFLIDDAVSAFNKTEGNFDIIYCDINKDGYPEAFNSAIPRLNQGGVLITDNTLWSGRVVENNPSKSTKGIIEYNKLCYNHPKLLTTLYPVRDGVSVSLKI